MSTQLDDPLYKIFEAHLHSGSYDDVPVEKFVSDVANSYWSALFKRGHVPHRMQETLKVDITHDVQDMLRLKIYGHFGIAEYNRRRRSKNP